MARRGFLVRVITAVQATMGATLAWILGTTVVGPSVRRREPQWLSAGDLTALRDEPVAVTLRLTRRDGYAHAVDRKVVYLIRAHDGGVTAMQSTCTHLGCQTSYSRDLGRIICPCHSGQYDLQGNVVAGPPPAPLPRLVTRTEGTKVFVQV